MFGAAVDAPNHVRRDAIDAPMAVGIGLNFNPDKFMILGQREHGGIIFVIEPNLCVSNRLAVSVDDGAANGDWPD